jgi:hypothetical protein
VRNRLHAICPYFAMFPESFVQENVEKYSRKGDWVFDPFCGRGTTILESLALGRRAAGSDINPVAYCISRAKAERPKLGAVHERINELEHQCYSSDQESLEALRKSLPEFYGRAFYSSTLRQLLFLRASLGWSDNKVDRFLAALVVGSLHGEMDRSQAYFSNQMPRTICLKPAYSLRYWRERRLFPKKRQVFSMLKDKADFRLKGLPSYGTGLVKKSDAREIASQFVSLEGKVSLVVTSPPYLKVTSYEEDQWLRLWFLGGAPQPTYGMVSTDDRHVDPEKYWKFLKDAWTGLAPLLKRKAKIVIRIGGIGIDGDEITTHLKASIQSVFPRARLDKPPTQTAIVRRQSLNFLPKSKGCKYELDYVFTV